MGEMKVLQLLKLKVPAAPQELVQRSCTTVYQWTVQAARNPSKGWTLQGWAAGHSQGLHSHLNLTPSRSAHSYLNPTPAPVQHTAALTPSRAPRRSTLPGRPARPRWRSCR